MKVKRMISNSLGAQTKKVIVILDLEIISPGSQVGAKIGNPQQLEADGKVTVVTKEKLRLSFGKCLRFRPTISLSIFS